METEYIRPRFRIANSYDELLKYKQDDLGYLVRDDDSVGRIELEDILKHKLVFIVAEPGHGKTRLIDELEKLSQGTIFRADFRTKLPQQNTADWLQNKGASAQDDVILLDGLDESPARDIASTIYGLVDYIKQRREAIFVISCRVHYFSNYQHIFSELPHAEYLLIQPLERQEAREFLTSLRVGAGTIKTLFDSMPMRQGQSGSVLQSPRYLELIAKKVKDLDFNVEQLNRSTLFASFVIGALYKEDEKNGRQLAEYKQRLLEQLALTMETAQVNEITSDEFVTFLDRAQSDIKLLLGNGEMESIVEHSLLANTDRKIRFTNTEVQEYLAARYITRMADPIRKTFVLAFDHHTRQLIPSWRNTVSYIIDELPEIARYIIDLQPSRLVLDENTEQLVTGVTADGMSQEDKTYIFEYIWNQHSQLAHFLDRDVSFNLARYANSGQIADILQNLATMKNTKSNHVPLLNVIIFCGNVLLLNKYNPEERKEVVSRLLHLALSSKNTTVQYNAVHALMSTEDSTILQQVLPLAASADDAVFGAVQTFAYELDRNSQDAIDLYIIGMKRNDLYRSRLGLEELDTVDAIGYFLQQLATDPGLTKPVIDHDRLFTKEQSNFLNNVNAHWQSSWLSLLKQFIILAFNIEHGYYAEHSAFVATVVRLIAEKDAEYFSELLQASLKPDDNGHPFLFRTSSSLAQIMPIDAVDHVVRQMANAGDEKWLLWRLIEGIPYSDNPKKAAIEQRARQLLPIDYKIHDKQDRKQQKQREENTLTAKFNKIYRQIADDITNKQLRSLGDAANMIARYLMDTNRREPLEYNETQTAYLWDNLKRHVLDHFDTSQVEFSSTRQQDGSKSYRMTNFVPWVEKALLFGFLTKRKDLGNYKQKILEIFPYMYEQQQNDFLENMPLNNEDISIIMKAFDDVDSDKAQFLPRNFIEFANTHAIERAVPVLRKMVFANGLMHYEKIEALRASEALKPDKAYLQMVLSHYQKQTDAGSRDIIEATNSLLIAKHEDPEAISRRFKLLRDRAFDVPTHESGLMYSVSDAESELHDKTMAKPLMSLTNQKYLKQFLQLLYDSFEINQKGAGWSRYAAYLWQICSDYFSNLSVTQDTSILRQIEEIVKKFPAYVTADFIRYMNGVRDKFLEQMGSKKPFVQAISLVNNINTIDEHTIGSHDELVLEVEELLKSLDRWVKQEGAKLADGDETNTQRNIEIRLDNLLLQKYGKTDVLRIERESQASDGTRTDFYVYSGFFGPVLVELKLSTHSDLNMSGNLKKKESFTSMQKYMQQFEARNGILLVYRHQKTEPKDFKKIITNATKHYETISGVQVIALGL
ncbi:MAG: hypothetical protein KA069_01230 [Candidatus Saccharimonas sp.]|nr:hypothetical protein [Candidatus Saccharimonas sp.]